MFPFWQYLYWRKGPQYTDIMHSVYWPKKNRKTCLEIQNTRWGILVRSRADALWEGSRRLKGDRQIPWLDFNPAGGDSNLMGIESFFRGETNSGIAHFQLSALGNWSASSESCCRLLSTFPSGASLFVSEVPLWSLPPRFSERKLSSQGSWRCSKSLFQEKTFPRCCLILSNIKQNCTTKYLRDIMGFWEIFIVLTSHMLHSFTTHWNVMF